MCSTAKPAQTQRGAAVRGPGPKGTHAAGTCSTQHSIKRKETQPKGKYKGMANKVVKNMVISARHTAGKCSRFCRASLPVTQERLWEVLRCRKPKHHKGNSKVSCSNRSRRAGCDSSQKSLELRQERCICPRKRHGTNKFRHSRET